MARIGFKKAKYNKHDGNKYAEAVKLFEKVIDEKFSPEYNSAELYANDGLAETDYSFKKGGLAITIADDDDKFIAELFGSEVSAEGEEVVQTINDTAGEFGYGHIIPKMVGGVRKYKVEFFPRVKFTKVTSDNKTRGENVEFSTTALEGTVYPLEKEFNGMRAGTWEKHQTFANEAEAEAYLDACLTPVS